MITTTNETLQLNSSDHFDYDYEEPPPYIPNIYAKAELEKSVKILSLVIYSLVVVLGVLGNGVVIWVTGFKMKKTINTVLYLNLAVADFLFTAFLPLRITEKALDDHWPFGTFMCKLNSTVLFLNMYASVYSLMVISIYRCVCVVWPVWAKNHLSIRKASCVSLGVWVLALALSSHNFIFKDTISFPDKDITTCVYKFARTNDNTPTVFQLIIFRTRAIIITRFLMGFVVPFTVIVSCYSVIIYRLRRNRSLASQSGRPFKIIAAVITTFFLCWAPYHILQLSRFIMEAGHSETPRILAQVVIIVFCLAYISSCLNPLLYVFMGQDFKNEVLGTFTVLKVGERLAIRSFRKLENAFTEGLPQTNTSTNPGTTSQEIALSEAQV